MSLSKQIQKLHYSTAQHELFVANGGSGKPGVGVRRLPSRSPQEVLFYTLPYALAAKDTAPLFAWCQYFARTEP